MRSLHIFMKIKYCVMQNLGKVLCEEQSVVGVVCMPRLTPCLEGEQIVSIDGLLITVLRLLDRRVTFIAE